MRSRASRGWWGFFGSPRRVSLFEKLERVRSIGTLQAFERCEYLDHPSSSRFGSPRRGRNGGRLEPSPTGRLDGDRPPPSMNAAEGRVVVTGQQGRTSIGGALTPCPTLPGPLPQAARAGVVVADLACQTCATPELHCRASLTASHAPGRRFGESAAASSPRPCGPSFHSCRRVKLEFPVNSSHPQLSDDPVGGGVDHVHVILGMQSEAARTRITTPSPTCPTRSSGSVTRSKPTTGRSRRSMQASESEQVEQMTLFS